MSSNSQITHIIKLTGISLLGACLLMARLAYAAASLDNITYNALPGDKIEVVLQMSGDIPEPGSFTIDNPARIALDLPATTSNLQSKNIDIGIGSARNVSAVEAGGRTRVVISLTRLVAYDTRRDGNNIIVSLFSQGGAAQTAASTSGSSGSSTASGSGFAPTSGVNSVQNVDFRRGTGGEGRVILTLTNPNTPIDMSRRGDQVIVTLKDIRLPNELERRLDVLDFGTPVRTVDAFAQGSDVRVVLTAAGEFEHLAYQSDNRLTIDVKKYVKPKEKIKKKKEQYTGERLSLNFQNIEVRAVLQLIADFTGLNMVTSDSVSGSVTLRLKNVPWDQALDIILKTKGLAKRQKGNVILVAPAAEIAAQEKLELEAQKQVVELAPLISETIQVNYAKAGAIAALLKSKGNSLLSARGNITIDQRTNKLLIQDTAANIDAVAALVEELDVPIRQVLIESRIALVTTNFSHELGVRFGVSTESSSGSRSVTTSGDLNSADAFNRFGVVPNLDDRLNVNLPATSPTGSIGLAIAKLPFGTLIDLELSAAEAEGKSETISSPRVITSDQTKARILQGTEIPYLEASSSGAATIAFKEAVLSLEVVPQITPDDRVNMNLKVNKDSPDFGNLISTGQGAGAPPINTQEVETTVLVDNGETIVLGGVYEQTKSLSVNRVPFFGDLPVIGFLFRNKVETDDKSELLIFVTPKIIKDNVNI